MSWSPDSVSVFPGEAARLEFDYVQPPPRAKREPRFPFQYSSTRPRDLVELPHQSGALRAFVSVAQQQQSQPTGFYESSSSDPHSSSDEAPVNQLSAAEMSQTKHRAGGTINEPEPIKSASTPSLHQFTLLNHNSADRMDLPARAPSQQSPSLHLSETSSLIASGSNLSMEADRYLELLTARAIAENPDLDETDLHGVLLRKVTEAFRRSALREKVKEAAQAQAAQGAARAEARAAARIPVTSSYTDNDGDFNDAWGPPPVDDFNNTWGPPPVDRDRDRDNDDDVGLPAIALRDDSWGDPPKADWYENLIPAQNGRTTHHPQGAVVKHVDSDNESSNDGEDESEPEKMGHAAGYESSDDDDDLARHGITNAHVDYTGSVPRLRCDTERCGYHCDATSLMVTHKAEFHHVCFKCDVEFNTTESLDLHYRVSESHFLCWVCQTDFHTPTARNRHIAATHPDSKEISCPGCGVMYPNQTSFIMHFELKACEGITEEQFRKARNMVGRIRDVEVVEHVLENEDSKKPAITNRIITEYGHDKQDYPGLPGLDISQRKTPTQFPGQMAPDITASASVAGATTNLVKKLQAMSVDGPMTSVKLAPKEQRLWLLYQKMVGPEDGKPQIPEDRNGNVLRAGIPGDECYNPGVFWDDFHQKFYCPHTFCKKKYKSEMALDQHLKSPAHQGKDLRCPECFDGFKSSGALMAHFEAPSTNCNIRKSDMYVDAVEVASGALLQVKMDNEGNYMAVAQEPVW